MNRRSRFSWLVLAAALPLVLSATPSQAKGGARTFKVEDYSAFDAGETEGAAIESSGRVSVGFLPRRGEIKATTAFTCIGAKRGAIVGTSDKASILVVSPTKRRRTKAAKPGRKDKGKAKSLSELKVAKVADLKGVVVSAMAVLRGGDVLAATLPGGIIYRVTPRGKVTQFAKLKVDQIWAMLVHKGRLLVATGPKGELFSLSMSGKDAKVILDVDEKDLLSLATVGNKVVVGTAPRAKLFQVSDELEGVLLHDFAGDEVRALALTRTGLLAAVNKFSDRKLSSLDALTKTLNRTSLVGQPAGGQLSGERPPNAEASVYHVDLGKKRDLSRASEAPWERWLKRDKQYFTDLLALDDKGTVLVASSAGGKVYRVRGPRDVSTVADLEERQTTGLCQLPSGPIFATAAHGAGVYQLQAAPAAQAKYRTKVFDAKQPAAFGAVVLRGNGPLKVRARSGPSDEPDKRWSDWKRITVAREAGGFRGSLATLPRRRYVQLEVALGSPTAELRGLEVFYAPENLAPLLSAIDVDRPSFDAGSSKEPDPKVTIKWKVDARDDDALVYDIRVRPEGTDDSQWVKLNRATELVTKKELKWDLTTVPDGVYEIEVTASDEPTHGTTKARKDELVSGPFVVDRQRPRVAGAVVSGSRVRARATDAGGYIHDVAFSIDGGPFRATSPTDGLFDSANEQFELTLPSDLGPGRHRVTIRARDSFGNIGTLALIVKR